MTGVRVSLERMRIAIVGLLLLTASCSHSAPPPAVAQAALSQEEPPPMMYVRCYDSTSASASGVTVSYMMMRFPSGGALISCSVADNMSTSSWTVPRPAETDDEPLDTRCVVTHDITEEPTGGFWTFEFSIVRREPRLEVRYMDAGEGTFNFEVADCGFGTM